MKYWIMTADQALKFYETAGYKEAITEKERIQILEAMNLKSGDEKDLAKLLKGKKVLRVSTPNRKKKAA